MKRKCIHCKFERVVGKLIGANDEVRLNIHLCHNCWDIYYNFYYNIGIPDHIPAKQHKKYLIKKISKS